MEPNFWHKKWQESDIGFHNTSANPLLVKHFSSLGMPANSRIFLPLCGKTLDIRWLLSQGYSVVGAELSSIAIEQLFAELGVIPNIVTLEKLQHYSAPNIDIFVGDIFDVTMELLGRVDAIYDRAALVALPPHMRERYARHLIDISHAAPQLLICFDYDQKQLAGPPFSINREEVNNHYQSNYSLTLLESADVVGKLKGQCEANENVWLLKKQ